MYPESGTGFDRLTCRKISLLENTRATANDELTGEIISAASNMTEIADSLIDEMGMGGGSHDR